MVWFSKDRSRSFDSQFPQNGWRPDKVLSMSQNTENGADRHTLPSRSSPSEKRPVGRPQQSETLSGRAILLERMRQFMNERPCHNFQRKEVAEFANVSPALVSYYFPEKQDFVIEAASPLIVTYSDDVTRILETEVPLLVKTKKLVAKFIELGLRSGYTMDYFLVAIHSRKRDGEIALIAEQHAAINNFMEQLISAGRKSPLSPDFLQSSIWAQCTYLSRQPHLRAAISKESQEEVIKSLTANVLYLLTNGISITNQM